jgi:hypothetical protein
VQLRSTVCCAFLGLLSFFQPPVASARDFAPTVTFVDGKSTIISGTKGFLPAAGVRLRQCDIVQTGPKALVQVEFEDGGVILLGPDSRFLFDLPYVGEPVVGPNFLLSGWAKITVPKRAKAPAYRINTPHFDVSIDAGAAVVHASADAGQFFVEQGDAVVLVASGRSVARVPVGSGNTYSRNSTQERGAVSDGVDRALGEGLPPSLRDSLPSMMSRVRESNVQPKPAPDFSPAEAAEWQKSVARFRPCFADVTVRGAQETLQRSGFDVGPIDGILGVRTQEALSEFQRKHGLTPSGQLDLDTVRALSALDRR